MRAGYFSFALYLRSDELGRADPEIETPLGTKVSKSENSGERPT